MSKEIAKQLVDKYIKSFGDTEIPIDEMYYNEAKSDGIMMRNFLEDFAEDILDQQTKELQQRIDELENSLEINNKLKEEDTNDFIKALNEVDEKNKQLQSRISELEKVNYSLKEAFKRGSELNDKLKFD